MIAFLGLIVFHALGTAVRRLVTGCTWRDAWLGPSSAWFAVVPLYLFSLGLAGLALLLCLVLAAEQAWPRGGAISVPMRFPWGWFAALSLVVLVRPWVPTQWDEFVWLGKARLESLGIGAGLRAALNPEAQLIPPGYPPLWPAAVGWLSLGHDSLSGHVVAASLLVLLCGATAAESLSRLGSWQASHLSALAVCATPLVWVHARSTYVDLPVGLLGVALLVWLVTSTERVPLVASVVAVVMVGLKDEGLVHVAAVTTASLLVRGFRPVRQLWPLVCAVLGFAAWRWLVSSHDIHIVDHGLHWPAWGWGPRFIQLLTFHATDVYSWGVFWVACSAMFLFRSPTLFDGGIRVTLLVLLVLTGFGLMLGPERVRVFAENGSLLNRVLIQLWPYGALALTRWSAALAQPR